MKKIGLFIGAVALIGCTPVNPANQSTTITTTTPVKKTGTVTYKEVEDNQEKLYKISYVDNMVKTVDIIFKAPFPEGFPIELTQEQKEYLTQMLREELDKSPDIKGMTKKGTVENGYFGMVFTIDLETVDLAQLSDTEDDVAYAKFAKLFGNRLPLEVVEKDLKEMGAVKVD